MSEQDPRAGTALGPHQWWQALVLGRDARLERVLVVASARHPDGARVVLGREDVSTLGDAVVCEAVLHEGEVSHLHVGPRFAPKAPPVWFVELTPGSVPGARDLVAFDGPGHAPGELIDGDVRTTGSAGEAEQLGAIRWWPETGEVDQVYVQPAWRRRHLASLLVNALAGLTAARDRPRLWGDGQRTEMGEALRNARSWRERTAPLEHVAPPMTPGGPTAT